MDLTVAVQALPQSTYAIATTLANAVTARGPDVSQDYADVPPASRQCARTDWNHDHAHDCECRMCWCGRIEARIRTAVLNEHILKGV